MENQVHLVRRVSVAVDIAADDFVHAVVQNLAHARGARVLTEVALRAFSDVIGIVEELYFPLCHVQSVPPWGLEQGT